MQKKRLRIPWRTLISVPTCKITATSRWVTFNRTQDVLNIQPVIPVKLNEQWNLIHAHNPSPLSGSLIPAKTVVVNMVSET